MNESWKKYLEYLLEIALEEEQNPDYRPSLRILARQLGVDHSTLSRALGSCRKLGILDEENRFTESGESWVAERRTQFHQIESWLLGRQVPREEARSTAISILKSCPDRPAALLSELIATCGCCEKKNMHGDVKKWFGMQGTYFREKLGYWYPDGEYQVKFYFWKERDKMLRELSMADESFVQPGILSMKDGEGTVCLRRRKMRQQSASGQWFEGTAETLSYEQNDAWCAAELSGDQFSIPLSAFWIAYKGNTGQLRGMLRMKMTCTEGKKAMLESSALLEIRMWDRKGTGSVPFDK